MDFPDPSEPSTMMRVPGRSSAEKKIFFFVVFGFCTPGLFGFFGADAVFGRGFIRKSDCYDNIIKKTAS